MPYSLLTQLALIVIAIALVFTYIRPNLTEVTAIQDEIYEYSDAVGKAQELNNQLRELISLKNSFSVNDVAALEQFLPTEIDAPQVMRDIEFLVDQNEVTLVAISFDENMNSIPLPVDEFAEGVDPNSSEVNLATMPHSDFVLTVNGQYAEIKAFLLALESNDYPLEIVSMELVRSESDGSTVNTARNPFLDVNLRLRVYALQAQNEVIE